MGKVNILHPDELPMLDYKKIWYHFLYKWTSLVWVRSILCRVSFLYLNGVFSLSHTTEQGFVLKHIWYWFTDIICTFKPVFLLIDIFLILGLGTYMVCQMHSGKRWLLSTVIQSDGTTLLSFQTRALHSFQSPLRMSQGKFKLMKNHIV